MVENALYKGTGLKKLKQMIQAQNGDARVSDDPSLLPIARRIIPIKAGKTGYIVYKDARAIGISAMLLGAGRSTKDGIIDPGVGIVMKNRFGEMVRAQDTIAEFYINDEIHLAEALKVFNNSVKMVEHKPECRPLIYGTVTEKGIER